MPQFRNRWAPLALTGLSIAAVGCGQTASGGGRSALGLALEATFPGVVDLEAADLTFDEACWTVGRTDGTRHAVAPDGKPCYSSAPGSADADLHAALVAIRAASGDAGRITAAGFEFAGGGEISHAEFELGSCSRYVFDPGYGQLPDGDSYRPIRMDDDWYELSCS